MLNKYFFLKKYGIWKVFYLEELYLDVFVFNFVVFIFVDIG